MIQNALTAIIPILPAKLPALTTFLQAIGSDVEHNPQVRFRETPSTHFARWVILNDAPAPRLYFSACYDGSFVDYIQEITAKLGAGMEPIWTCCQGYPPGAAMNAKALIDFLTPYCHPPGIFLISFPGLSVQQIIDNSAFRERFDNCLDAAQTGPAAATVLTAAKPAAKPTNSGYGTLATRIVDWLVGVTPGAPAQNTITTTNKDLLAVEDIVVQNQMTIVSPVKKGFRPRLVLRFFLWLGHWLNKINKPSPNGELSGLSTIHFARWVLIDGGDRLLFESNYDGSWENYIDDFGDHAATGMNAIWGTSVGYPKGGCLDIEAFKDGIRRYQHPAQFFYSAYPSQTVRNIASDRQMRQDLAAAEPFMSGALD